MRARDAEVTAEEAAMALPAGGSQTEKGGARAQSAKADF